MEERAPLDRQSLQHTSKEPEAQVWAQIGTPQYNPPVPQAQAEPTNKVTSPLDTYKIPKLGSSSSSKADESGKSSEGGHEEESDEELQVDENAETVLAEVEATGPNESTDSKTPKKKEEMKEERKLDKQDKKSDFGEDGTPYTSSNDPKLIKARVFVGQLDTSKVTKKDVEKVFEPFGKLLGVLLLNGYGFVQYEEEESAKKAIKDAHGAEICGSKIGET